MHPGSDLISLLVAHAKRDRVPVRSFTNYCTLHCYPFPEHELICPGCAQISERNHTAAEAALAKAEREN